MSALRPITAFAGKATIRTRVALAATLLAVTCLGVLGYLQIQTMSTTFDEVADEQGLTLTTQLSEALVGAGQGVVQVIPFTEEGLDGIATFDSSGRVQAHGGGLDATVTRLRSQALAAARTKKTKQEFRLPEAGGRSTPVSSLRPWSSPRTIQVTIVPQSDGGAVVAAYHVDWATEKLKGRAYSILLSVAGGAGFICFGLMLMLSRLVTRPVGRLAGEVRQLGEGNLVMALSDQSSPELQQLASDISQMRDDLIVAVRQSSTDPLTGIANHRAFHDRLEEAVANAERSAQPLGLIAIDLDRLKEINDVHGHMAGDRVLEAVAAKIADTCGPNDLCARVGGDEFAVVCPAAEPDAVATLADRIRTAVSALGAAGLVGGDGERVKAEIGVSVGFAHMPATARTREELIHHADTQLYRAKTGRGHDSTEELPIASAQPPEGIAAVVRALAVAVDAKDSGTRSHCQTVSEYAVAIAERMGFAAGELESIRRVAVLHDVGKIGTPDAVLGKPSRLTEEEYTLMKRHSELGYRILINGGLPLREAQWVLHHHEHLDGSGYPHGLRGDEIPIQSRIILVADAFEAMTSDRPYRAGRPMQDALTELRRCAGTQFDPEVVDELARVIAGRINGAGALPEPRFDDDRQGARP